MGARPLVSGLTSPAAPRHTRRRANNVPSLGGRRIAALWRGEHPAAVGAAAAAAAAVGATATGSGATDAATDAAEDLKRAVRDLAPKRRDREALEQQQLLRRHRSADRTKVKLIQVTKIGVGLEKKFVDHNAISSVKQSCRRLNQSQLYAVMLHRPEVLLGSQGSAIARELQTLKEQGVITKIGISVYSPEIMEVDIPEVVLKPLYEDLNTPGYIANLHQLYEKASKGEDQDIFISACKFIGLFNEDSKQWESFKKNKASISE